jgi:hypothetical protein
MTAITHDYAHVRKYRTRHGNVVYQFRPPRPLRAVLGYTRLPGEPGSKQFTEAYWAAERRMADAIAGNNAVGEKRVRPGSMAALIAKYYDSLAFRTLSEKSKYTYKAIIEPIREKHGERLVADLTRDKVEKMMAKRLTGEDGKATHATANFWLRQLHMLMQFAIKHGMRRDDPTAGVDKVEYDNSGHATASEEQIAAFENNNPAAAVRTS